MESPGSRGKTPPPTRLGGGSNIHTTTATSSQTELDGGDVFRSGENLMQSKQRRKRELLKNYYGLVVEGTTSPTAPSLLEMDSSHFQSDAHVGNLLRDRTLAEIIQTDNELVADIKVLDGDMKTLVYENYNKFISATATVAKMKESVVEMEREMTHLATNVDTIIQHSEALNTGMASMRARIHQLAGVHELLQKLGFIFELPLRLKQAIKGNQLAQAVAYYFKTSKLLANYRNLSLFQKVEVECATIMEGVGRRLRERIRHPAVKPAEVCESCHLLLALQAPREEVAREFLQHIQASMQRTMVRAMADVQLPTTEIMGPERLQAIQATWLEDMELVVRTFEAEFVEQPIFGALPTTTVATETRPSGPIVVTAQPPTVGPGGNMDSPAVRAVPPGGRATLARGTSLLIPASEEQRATYRAELQRLSDRLCQEYLGVMRQLVPPTLDSRQPGMTPSLLAFLDFLLADISTKATCLSRLSGLHERVCAMGEGWIRVLLQHAFASSTGAFFAKLQGFQHSASLEAGITEALTQLKHSLTQETLPFLQSLVPSPGKQASLNTLLQAQRSEVLTSFWSHFADQFDPFREREQRELVDAVQMARLVLTLAKASFEVSRVLVEEVFLAFAEVSKAALPAPGEGKSAPVTPRLAGRHGQYRPFAGQGGGVGGSELHPRPATLPPGEQARAREVAALFKAKAQDLVRQYVGLRTQHLCTLIREHVRGDAASWLARPPPSRPSRVWTLVLADMRAVDAEVTGLLDDDGSIARKERHEARRPVRPTTKSGAVPSRFDAMLTNIGGLFGERVEYLPKTDFSRPAVLMACIKVILKCYKEEVRQITLGREGFDQQQVDLEYLLHHLAQWSQDDRLLHGLVESVLLDGYARCLDPREVDAPTLAAAAGRRARVGRGSAVLVAAEGRTTTPPPTPLDGEPRGPKAKGRGRNSTGTAGRSHPPTSARRGEGAAPTMTPMAAASEDGDPAFRSDGPKPDPLSTQEARASEEVVIAEDAPLIWQFLGVAAFVGINIGLLCSGLVVLLAAFVWPLLWLLLLPYLAWVFLLDAGIEAQGARLSAFGRAYRNWAIWDGYRAYFSSRLIKTADLDPGREYLFGFHPHGVYCFSLWGNLFANPAFERLFPGIQLHPATLPLNFYLPLWRDLLLHVGGISVDRASLRAVLIAVGGAEEFQFMEAECMDLVLMKRKGFCHLALETGAALVPVLSFGETDLFSACKSPWLQPLNSIVYALFKCVLPVFTGATTPAFPGGGPS